MTSTASSPKEYLDNLPEDRKEAVNKLRKIILENLPIGFEETMSYGMIGYVVPHRIYPEGYHCDPNLPLPFMSIASQKNFIALYHSGIYADEALHKWFTEEYSKHSKIKPDMGKSCIRFKKPEQIPYDLIAELCRKLSPEEYIALYLQTVKRR